MNKKPSHSRKACEAAFLAGGFAACTCSSHALEASDVLLFSREPVAIMPQASVGAVYNDNIFFLEKDVVGDISTVVSPGVKIRVGREDGNHIQLDYIFNEYFYSERTELDTHEHILGLRSKIEQTRFSVTGVDRFGLLSSPLGGAERSGLRQNIDRTTFFDEYNLSLNLTEKSSVYLAGTHSTVDYQRDVGLYDNNTLKGTAGFMFLALPKTSFFGEVFYGQTASAPNLPGPKNPHMDFVGGSVGARGSFTEKITGIVKVGYENREFSDNTPAPSSPVVSAAINYAMTERSLLVLGYNRVNDISVQYAKQSYTADMLNLRYSHLLGLEGKLRANVGGSYSFYDYAEAGFAIGRSIDLYSANFSLEYRIQLWLSASLGYDFESYHSLDGAGGTIDYEVNRITLRLAVGY